MRTLLLIVLALMVAGCEGCASVPDYATPGATSVRIETEASVCTATAVGRYTLLTARHCLAVEKGALSIDGQKAAYELLADDGKDHVLIRVSLKQASVAALGPKPRAGDVVYKWGNPMGLRRILIIGRVAGWLGDGTMLIDSTGFKGDSGAAYFDSRGRIVGVVSAIGGKDAFYLVAAFPLAFSAADWERVS